MRPSGVVLAVQEFERNLEDNLFSLKACEKLQINRKIEESDLVFSLRIIRGYFLLGFLLLVFCIEIADKPYNGNNNNNA